jgi:hypothetical protein
MLHHLAGMKQVKKVVYVYQNIIFNKTKMGYSIPVSNLFNDVTYFPIAIDLCSTPPSWSSVVIRDNVASPGWYQIG